MQDEEPVPAISISSSQGVQAGAGVNVQFNNWMPKPPLDPVALSKLTPHAAMDRLKERSHREVVDLFAGAVPADIADLFRFLVEADEALVVAVLGDIHGDKAKELISLYAPRLKDLPTAAKHIDGLAGWNEWNRDGEVGHLERLGDMYLRGYAAACICWTVEDGVTQISQPLMKEYCFADFGRPTIGNGTTYHFFEKGAIFLSDLGIIGVSGGIYKRWHESAIPLPISARENYEDHSRQHFATGTIYESKQGSFFVRSDLPKWNYDMIPLTDEGKVTSSCRTMGVIQRFSRKLPHFQSDQEILICSSKEHGTFEVADHILVYYEELGGVKSWLGFPVSGEERVQGEVWVQQERAYSKTLLQRFEGGIIYYPDGHPPAAVQAETLDLIGKPDGRTKLGWPISEDLPVGQEADRIQFFECGAVALRGGQREILVRRYYGGEDIYEN